MDENQTLAQLDGQQWGEPTFDSHLINRCHLLRETPIKDLTIEDLRLLIGQNIGLPFLIPKAITCLKKSILAEGDFYEGDLLYAVLTADEAFWRGNEESWKAVHRLFEDSKDLLKSYDTTTSIKENWFKAFQKFEELAIR